MGYQESALLYKSLGDAILTYNFQRGHEGIISSIGQDFSVVDFGSWLGIIPSHMSNVNEVIYKKKLKMR